MYKVKINYPTEIAHNKLDKDEIFYQLMNKSLIKYELEKRGYIETCFVDPEIKNSFVYVDTEKIKEGIIVLSSTLFNISERNFEYNIIHVNINNINKDYGEVEIVKNDDNSLLKEKILNDEISIIPRIDTIIEIKNNIRSLLPSGLLLIENSKIQMKFDEFSKIFNRPYEISDEIRSKICLK